MFSGDAVGTFPALLLMAFGVAISVVLPVLSAYVLAQFRPTARAINLRKYLALLAFSLVTGIILLAAYRTAQPKAAITWYGALLFGYGWEATLAKLTANE